jgi:hypothetical protein
MKPTEHNKKEAALQEAERRRRGRDGGGQAGFHRMAPAQEEILITRWPLAVLPPCPPLVFSSRIGEQLWRRGIRAHQRRKAHPEVFLVVKLRERHGRKHIHG